MSFTADRALVAQFSANVMHLAQQSVSRLSGTVSEEPITGEKAFFDQVGVVTLIQKTARHQDTPHTEIPHDRRMCIVRDFLGNEYIDRQDQVKMLASLSSPYAQAFSQGVGRLKDDVIIEAASATAYTGKDGTTTQAFDTSNNRIASTYQEDGSSAAANLTVGKVRKANQILNSWDVEDGDRCAVIGSSQLQSLQRDDEFTSRDFNVMQPLMSGRIPEIEWMGFTWRRSERLAVASSVRTCLFYHKTGIKIGTAMTPTFRIEEAGWKNFAVQVHVSVSWGATRMDEKKVVECLCNETV